MNNVRVKMCIQFDPISHQPPRIDVFGWNLQNKKKPGEEGTNALATNVRIPEWWSKPGVPEELKQTNTRLIEERRKEKVPHISYDLDGDGFVGGRDYVIAKQFDKDGDGRLNTNEKKAAFEAINSVIFEIANL